MEKYLDPKADLTFKKVFGEHPDLVISLLNALLPLDESERIQSVEYLPKELVPENSLRENSFIDVRCKDNLGRQFIIEMQKNWSQEFQMQFFFNNAKAYVRQMGKGGDYSLLLPVYSLNLVNDVIDPTLPGYYHSYKLVHEEHSDRVIDGLRLVFVELPKFKPQSFSQKKMHVLWLRYLTEIHDDTTEISSDLKENPVISKALTEICESAFTNVELESYEKFWDAISVEITRYNSVLRKGRKEGRVEGIQDVMKNLKQAGMAIPMIAQVTGLTESEIEKL